jgi:CheY-like chemotaxis protein
VGADRRRWERFAVPAKVLVAPREGDPFEARIQDVSAGGAFVMIANPSLPFRARIRITFYPGGGDRALEIEAEVVHSSPAGFGVEFAATTTESTRSQILEWAKGIIRAKQEAAPLREAPEIPPGGPKPLEARRRPAARRPGTRAPNILLVQDDAEMSKLLAGILERLVAELVIVNDAGEVTAALERRSYDVIICDWVPLDQNPEGLIRTIKSHAAKTPIVVISALAKNVPFVTRARHVGVTDLISKPFKLKDFLLMLNRVLSRSS